MAKRIAVKKKGAKKKTAKKKATKKKTYTLTLVNPEMLCCSSGIYKPGK